MEIRLTFKKFRKIHNTKIKLAIKLFTIFLLPLFLALFLYPLNNRVIFNGKDYQQSEFKIENIFQKKPTFKSFFSDIFSVPLFLDWYVVTITNNSVEENPNCLENDPPTVFFTFIKGDPRIYYSNLKETTAETGGGI